MTELPIEHLSFSAMRSFCSNPASFKKNYILNLWDYKTSITAMGGKAFHRFAENYFKGVDIERATKEAYNVIEETPDTKIDFGKTGSREQIIKVLNAGIEFFLQERPDVGEVLDAEMKLTTDVEYEGRVLPLPIKAVTDLVTRKNGEIVGWDWKLTISHTDKEEENPQYVLQAMFNYFIIKAKYGEAPKRFYFVEIKKSKYRDGSPQLEYYEIEFDKHPEYFTYFYRMYSGVVLQLANPDIQFLPNFNDQFTGKEAWEDFTAEIMDFNLPKQISHKSVMTKNVESNYVESTVDKHEAKDLTDAEKIEAKLLEFGLPVDMQDIYEGSNVTLYTMKPSRGVRVSAIRSRAEDLEVALAKDSVRITTVAGTRNIGVEVPNEEQKIVPWTPESLKTDSLMLPVGVDVFNKLHHLDLAKAPHLLIAGATGAGKSVAMNVFISSLVEQNNPEDLKLLLIDPKRSEFFDFEGIPHQLLDEGVVTEVEDAEVAMRWAVDEMERRYKVLQENRTRDIDSLRNKGVKMAKIVIVIDELADLLMVNTERMKKAKAEDSVDDIEQLIIRVAQKARAVGIHMIVATQRPSVDVITGLIKANFPTRIAFMTSSGTDSKVILDQTGAETLIGNGDLLLSDPRRKGLIRLQGLYKETE